MSILWVAAVLWVILGSVILYFSLSARTLIHACEREITAGTLRNEFLPFARRDFKDLPSLWMFVVRAFTVGPLSFLTVVSGLISASLSSMILPAALLPWAMALISYWTCLGFGVVIKERGKRAKLSDAPCVVANHGSACDIIVLLTKRVSFVSMEGVKDLYFIGRVARALGCIFVSRDSKESRSGAKQAIIDRLRGQMNGTCSEKNPLIVFPEGSTNNGHYLLEFRRGAFEPKTPVQPLRIEYSDYHANFTVLAFLELGALCMVLPGREVMLHWMPVIQPADSPEETAALARKAIAEVPSAYNRAPVALTDAGVSHRDAIACADYMRAKSNSSIDFPMFKKRE